MFTIEYLVKVPFFTNAIHLAGGAGGKYKIAVIGPKTCPKEGS